jgi:hypothetical protein
MQEIILIQTATEFVEGEVIHESPKYTGGYIVFEGETEKALYRDWLRQEYERVRSRSVCLLGGAA